MTTPKKLIGAAAFSVVLAAGGAAGALLGTPLTSGAQESTTSTTVPADSAAPAAPGHPHRGERIAEKLSVAAEALGISEADLRAALEGGKTIAQVAQEQGVDVDTVIDALVADAQTNLRERITAMVNGERPAGGGQQGRGGRGGRAFAPDLQAVAGALGITTDEVRTALEGGQTLAQIAAANNVDVQDVIDAMVAGATAKIDEKVAAGELDADRAAEMKSHLVERVTAIVNGERPAHHSGPDDTETP